MKRIDYSIICLFTLSFLFTSCSSSTSNDDFKHYRNLSYTSEGLQIQYDVRVYLPLAYQENKNLPVIYIMEFVNTVQIRDDAKLFDKAIEAITTLGIDAIIVAGDKFDEGENFNFNNFEDFYGVMVDELVPLIDSEFDNNNDSRTLLGWQISAGHALLTMLTETPVRTTFQNYIATDIPSPSGITLDTIIINDDFPQDKSDIRLHLSSSSYSIDVRKLVSGSLENKNYPWLTFEYKEFPEANLDNNVEAAFKEGITYIFK